LDLEETDEDGNPMNIEKEVTVAQNKLDEILVAKNEFAAYFVSSAERSSITIIGFPCLTNGKYNSSIIFFYNNVLCFCSDVYHQNK
jgi:hypothetical protein